MAHLFTRACLVLMGLLVGVLICELVLRLFGYEGEAERLTTVFDPRFGTVAKDSWIFDFNIDPKKHSHVDIRGQLIPLTKPKNETRVIFIGDSGTEGTYVPIGKSFPLAFKKLLDQHSPENRIRVINAGVWGMTTIDEFYFLKDRLMPLKPDVVVLGLFMANDINFNLGHAQRRLQSQTSSLLHHLRSRSALVHFLYLRALSLNTRFGLWRTQKMKESWVPVELGLIDEYGLHMLNYPAGEIATYMKRSSALMDHGFETLREIFLMFQTFAERNTFTFRVILIPTPSTVSGQLKILQHPDILKELNTQGIHIQQSDLDFMKPTRRVLEICEALDLTCIDPTRRLKKIGLRAFFPRDEHLTEAGHLALAQELLAN